MKKNRLIALISVIAALTAMLSLYMIISTLVTGAREQKAFDELAALGGHETDADLSSEDDAELEILPEYAALHDRNNDLFGWIRIDDTIIDYPVMHTPEEPQYYLNRAFDQSESQSGTPFVDASCYEGCGNYIIYGHHMKNGTMFGTLPKYADKEYWESHRMICFDTLRSHGEYEIIAAFYGKATKNEPAFRYYKYNDLTDPAVFTEYMEQVKAAAVYDTGITAEYGDELLTLSTCSYHTDNGRFVVVARKTENR